ncbi:MAG: VapC toxin family domain ribonuclease [Rickettsiaceae bacterium]|jgi:predicted nucleic acid-binding protein|nr:VapC toxin family domain ribonuclease [Rickettsiaceae bacterium]
MKYMLDTNVLSETIKDKPNEHVINWLESIPQERFYISVLTFGEIRKGIEMLSEGKRRIKLLNWLETQMYSWFNSRVVAIDAEVAEKWGYLAAINRSLPAIDGLIAATSIVHNLTLVTRNENDFVNIPGLEILNPWEL